MSKNLKKNKIIYIILSILSALGALYVWQNNATPKWSIRLFFSPYRAYRDILEAQFRHETGNGTSILYKEYHNMFGMGYPRSRKADNNGPSPTKTEGQYMSTYKNNKQAINDMVLYLTDVGIPIIPVGVEAYCSLLKARGYFTDNLINYTFALRKWMK